MKLGVAPSIIPFKKINASALSKALKSVLSQPRDGPLYTTAKRIAQQVETQSTYIEYIAGEFPLRAQISNI